MFAETDTTWCSTCHTTFIFHASLPCDPRKNTDLQCIQTNIMFKAEFIYNFSLTGRSKSWETAESDSVKPAWSRRALRSRTKVGPQFKLHVNMGKWFCYHTQVIQIFIFWIIPAEYHRQHYFAFAAPRLQPLGLQFVTVNLNLVLTFGSEDAADLLKA